MTWKSDSVKIEQRVHAGNLDTSKSRASSRVAAIPATLVSELDSWPTMLPEALDSWVFPSETGQTPVRPEKPLATPVGPRLEEVGLGWVNYEVLRRTHATPPHAAGVDPKVSWEEDWSRPVDCLSEVEACNAATRLYVWAG